MEHLDEIRTGITELIALYEGEKVKNGKLVSELEQKNAAIDSYRKQIADLERQVDNLKLRGAFTSPAGSDTGAKEKIEKMIAEIDKCISLLEK